MKKGQIGQSLLHVLLRSLQSTPGNWECASPFFKQYKKPHNCNNMCTICPNDIRYKLACFFSCPKIDIQWRVWLCRPAVPTKAVQPPGQFATSWLVASGPESPKLPGRSPASPPVSARWPEYLCSRDSVTRTLPQPARISTGHHFC